MASSNVPINPQALNDYEDDGSIADLRRRPNRSAAPVAPVAPVPPVAPVAPVPPTNSTGEEIRNEFYDKIRWLLDQQSREDEKAAEENPDSSDDNDESPEDPDLYSDDVQNAFAAYEQLLPQSEIHENAPYDETSLTTEELEEHKETYNQMLESWNYFALEYPLAQRPAEMLLNDPPSQLNNWNVEAQEFYPTWSIPQPIDVAQEEIDPNSTTSSQNDEKTE